LAAFAGVIRAVAPIDDIFVDGALLKGAVATPPVRVSGMWHGNRMAVLVADYTARESRTVALRLPIMVNSVVIDAETGQRVGAITTTDPALSLSIGCPRSRLLLVEPARRD
jgi:hypothetical protein